MEPNIGRQQFLYSVSNEDLYKLLHLKLQINMEKCLLTSFYNIQGELCILTEISIVHNFRTINSMVLKRYTTTTLLTYLIKLEKYQVCFLKINSFFSLKKFHTIFVFLKIKFLQLD